MTNFRLLLEDIVHASSMLHNVSLSFVSRDENRVGHELAHCLPRVLAR